MISYIKTMKNVLDLSGKTAIVTGGNGGIGLGIAKAFAECGVNVAVLCRNMTKADSAIKQLNEIGGKHKVYTCDILIPKSIREAVDAVCKDYGNIDILVNNSGVAVSKKFLDMEPDFSDWRYVVDTNLTGLAQMTYEVAKRMRDAGKGGVIINNTSNAGSITCNGMNISSYCASKAGADHFTRCMAVELAEYDIRVNAIAPGFIKAGFGENPTQLLLNLVEAKQPLKRMGEAIEIGALAVFLASPAAAHITGEVIKVDGGYTLST